jgi:enoyl-CoA hydratase/carnithine racemase
VDPTADIVASVEGAAAVVRLNRPAKLNAFTIDMHDALRDVVLDAVADDRVHGVIITGNGRGFCAGLDTSALTEAAGGRPPKVTRPPTELPALFSYLLNVPKPVIAAVNGPVAGGGLVLAMMCDLRFASPDASFTTAFSRRGLISEHGTAWLLPRLVGPSRALDLLWTARRFDAHEALRIGFVDHVLPADELVDGARAYIEDLAANVSPRSVAIMKSMVYEGLSQDALTALREADRQTMRALKHPDAKEGAASFIERRGPNFAPLGDLG